MDASDFSSVAKVVIAGYLVMLLVLGYLGYRKSTGSEEDYYLAGRGQGWMVTSLTIMATFFSAFALLGAPGLTYKEGVIFVLFARTFVFQQSKMIDKGSLRPINQSLVVLFH